MRYRIKEYNIGGDTDFSIAGKVSIEDIRLIVNETQKKVICSSMNKSNVACNYVEDMDVTFITFDNSICELQPTDQLTIEIDKGEDLSSVESKVEEESAAIQSKIDNIDLSSVAKQGENQEATNSKILEEVAKIPDLKNIYSARFEQNSDGDNTWTMVMPVVSGVIMNEDDTVTIQM